LYGNMLEYNGMAMEHHCLADKWRNYWLIFCSTSDPFQESEWILSPEKPVIIKKTELWISELECSLILKQVLGEQNKSEK